MTLNPYQEDLSEVLSTPGGHRLIVGGLWDEMGKHQLDYLVNEGLKPADRLLDIGCGSLRAGVKLVPYLDAGGYYGMDLVPALLDQGYEKEIRQLGLVERLPRENLAVASAFEIPFGETIFDHALAQSLFSHLPINHLRLCLANLRPRMRKAGVFHASFFLVPDNHGIAAPCEHPPAGVQTFGWQDPYHYWIGDIAFAAASLGWHLEGVFDWIHPRGQKIARFHAV